MLAVVVVVATALVVGVVLGIRWWTHPDLFADDGSSSRVASKPVERATLHVGVTSPSTKERDEVELTFRDATAHFLENSAQAEATFWVCSGDNVVGTAGGRLEKHCDDPRRIERGTKMTYSSEPGSDYVVLTLEPTRPGGVRLDRVELDYFLGADQLYRRGTDSVDLDITVQAR